MSRRAWKPFVYFPKHNSYYATDLDAARRMVAHTYSDAVYEAGDASCWWEKDGRVVAEAIMHTEGDSMSVRMSASLAKAPLK